MKRLHITIEGKQYRAITIPKRHWHNYCSHCGLFNTCTKIEVSNGMTFCEMYKGFDMSNRYFQLIINKKNLK